MYTIEMNSTQIANGFVLNTIVLLVLEVQCVALGFLCVFLCVCTSVFVRVCLWNGLKRSDMSDC